MGQAGSPPVAAVSGPGISHAKACTNAGTRMGYRAMPIQVLAARWDIMAGGRGAAGQAQVIRHQEPGKLAGTLTQGTWTQFFLMFHIRNLVVHPNSAAVKHVKSMQKITGSNLVCTFFEPLIKLV